MNSLETSSMILSDPPAVAPSQSATNRPWYTWASAAVAALVAAIFLFFFIRTGGLPQNLATLNGLSSLIPPVVALTGLFAAVGLVLRQNWGKTLLLITGLLLLALFALGAIYFVGVMTAGYSSGFAVRLGNGFLLMLIALIPAISTWLAYWVVRRQSNRLAAVAMPISLSLVGLIILFLFNLG